MRTILLIGAGIILGVFGLWLWENLEFPSWHYASSGERCCLYEERPYSPVYEQPVYPAYNPYYRKSRRALPPCDWECGD